MKIKGALKWTLAAAMAVTTVAASASAASAYTYNVLTFSGHGIEIFGDGTEQQREYYRSGHDFAFSNENSALKQAVRFELSVDNDSYYDAVNDNFYDEMATIKFGGYDENGNKTDIGTFNVFEVYSGNLTHSLVEDNADSMASGKFWMELKNGSYSNIEIKSIKFYDKYDHCILYGCAQELNNNMGQWTFYQLIGPTSRIEGIQNDDGTYAMNANVISAGLMMASETSNGANANACTFKLNDAVKTFTMNGSDITGTQQLVYNPAEGANNEYNFVSSAWTMLEDTYNLDSNSAPTKIKLYSLTDEKNIVMDKLKIEAGEPGLLGELPTIGKNDFESADELLDALNNATSSIADSTASAIYVDSSVTDEIAAFRKAKVPKIGGNDYAVAKVVYDDVTDFDPTSHKAQTITLKAHIVANDIVFQQGYGEFVVKMNYLADYIDNIKISKLPKTDYGYGEALDLSNGELTITYNSGDTETVPMTDARVSATGFYGENGSLPAYNSDVDVTVIYTAEGGAYDPTRADGAIFTANFTAKIADIPALEKPIITPNGGSFSTPCVVSITAQDGAKIYYTTDGTVPTANSTEYTAPFTVTEDTTVKAIAVKENCSDSEIATAVFTVMPTTLEKPIITPNGGSFSNPCVVGITAQDGAKIYYTTDGTVPTANSTEYTAPFVVTKDTTVKAIAVKENCSDSEIATAVFTIRIAPNPPVIGGNRDNTREEYLFTINGGSEISHSINNGKANFVFDKASADKYVTLFKYNSATGKQVFLSVARTDSNAKVTVDLSAGGSYFIYIADTTFLIGDMNNDGVVNALDAAAILMYCSGIAEGANTAMGDYNGDGNINAFDASEILKMIAGLS